MNNSEQQVMLHRGDNFCGSAAATERSGVTPAEHSDRNAMKPARSVEFAQANLKPDPTIEPQPGEIQLPVWAIEHSGFASYRHWGINE
jgi:hypothetical protein